MASYATLADLKARAGVLAEAWSETTDPDDSDLELMLEQTAGELDAFIGGAGYPVPVTDEQAVGMLRSINADFALELAIQATWPQGAPDQAGFVNERCAAYRQAMFDGNLGVLLYLGQIDIAGTDTGASNFWTHDAYDALMWDAFADRLSGPGSSMWVDRWGVPLSAGPEFRRGMRL